MKPFCQMCGWEVGTTPPDVNQTITHLITLKHSDGRLIRLCNLCHIGWIQNHIDNLVEKILKA